MTRTPAPAGQLPLRDPDTTPTIAPRSMSAHHRDLLRRAGSPDHHRWLAHTANTRGCVRPVRLTGQLHTVEKATGRIVSSRHTVTAMPDGVLYVPCGDRRASRLPAVRGDLSRRHLPTHPRRTFRRQRRPHIRRDTSGRVRHAHRALLRARPHPADQPPDREGRPVPDAPRPHRLPARQAIDLHRPAHREPPLHSADRSAWTATTTPTTSSGTPGPANSGVAPPSPSVAY